MADAPRDCETVLTQTAHALRPLVRSRVHRLPGEIRHLVGMHFGWWTDDRTAVENAAEGKAVRPALALLACQAVGGKPEQAHLPAVAVELVHNASLLHDDIIDGDPVRRGRPALWAAKGVPAGILAGDALFFAAVSALADAPRSQSTIPVLLECVQTLIGGEYLDTLFEAGIGVSEDRVLAVAAGKTGELLACACTLGALAGGADPKRAAHLGAFGRCLGVAFQCLDDVLGIWGEEETTGKPAYSDLRSLKVTVPVAAAMAGLTPEARALRALYHGDRPLSEDDCRRAVDLIEQTGARTRTLQRARRYEADALEHLTLACPAPVPAAELTALAQMITQRDR